MMRSVLPKKVYSIIATVVLVVATLSVAGCSFVRHSVAALRSTDHFVSNVNDNRVLFEPGAEESANKLAEFLPTAIQQVEKKQFRNFVEPVRIYVCASRESFKKFNGADVRAGVLTKLFLSPRIFEYGDEVARKYLAHELSHLHLQQQIGIFKMNRLPMWFKEGLATSVSNGGGAHLISQEQATEFLRAGKHFVPNKADGFVFKKTPSDFGLKPQMFYRQSMMFINFLQGTNESGYRKLILGVENGKQITTVLEATYYKKLEKLWGDFLNEFYKKG
jgi:hypothetical protein